MSRCIRDKKGRFTAHDYKWAIPPLKLGDVYKECLRCGRKGILRLNLSVILYNHGGFDCDFDIVEIAEVLSETNDILADAVWEKAVWEKAVWEKAV